MENKNIRSFGRIRGKNLTENKIEKLEAVEEAKTPKKIKEQVIVEEKKENVEPVLETKAPKKAAKSEIEVTVEEVIETEEN